MSLYCIIRIIISTIHRKCPLSVHTLAYITIIIIIIMAYTAAFPQSGSSSAGIQVINASDIGQAVSTGEIPLLFSRSAVVFIKVPILG